MKLNNEVPEKYQRKESNTAEENKKIKNKRK